MHIALNIKDYPGKFHCKCCKKLIPNYKAYMIGGILFNGCKNCYDYLTELMENVECKRCKKSYEQ